MSHPPTRRAAVQACLGALLPVGLARPALAQEAYPSGPVRIVVGFSAGTPPEVFARLIADRFAKSFKQPFIVDNKPGAGSVIATGQVAKAKPDGLTLLLGVASGLGSGPHLIPGVNYDPRVDFEPVGFVQRGAYFISARPDLPIKSLKDLVDYAKSSPQPLSYGTPGVGTLHHLIWEVLQAQTGIKLVHVPYPGTPQMVNEGIAGRLDLMLEGASSLMVPHVRAGKINYIATTGGRRSPSFPHVATAAEQGFAQIQAESWWVMVAPRGTPETILRPLRAELAQVLATPEAKRLLESLGAYEDGGPTLAPEQIKGFIKSEYERWGEVIRRANIKTSG
jgi:tripartite-type tricarboxylate transporter receptor subunit TctC